MGDRSQPDEHDRLTGRKRVIPHDPIPWLLAIVTLASRVAFFPKYPTEWDSVQLVMGVRRFDVTEGSPHAPGYWLYVVSGRLLHWLTPLDAHHSLLVLSATAAGGTVAVVYLVGRELGRRALGLGAAAFLATSPFLWFYGSIAATYAFDSLAAALLLLWAVRARPGSYHGVLAAVTIGLAAGFRLSGGLLLVPLALAVVVRSTRSWRAAVAAVGAGAVSVAVWFVPMLIEQPGGFRAWWHMDHVLPGRSVAGHSILHGGPQFTANLHLTQAHFLVALAPILPATALGILGLVVARRSRERHTPAGFAVLAIALAGIVPALGVALTFFGKAGYALAALPGLVLLALLAMPERGSWRTVVLIALLVGCAFNAERFVFARALLPDRLVGNGFLQVPRADGAPFAVTARAIANVDADTKAYLALRRVVDPRRDVIVVEFNDGGRRFRNLMFTMPDETMHLTENGLDIRTGRHDCWTVEGGRTISVGRGGFAWLIIDHHHDDVDALVAQGVVKPVHLATGPTVWKVPIGATVVGVRIVEDESGGPPGIDDVCKVGSRDAT